MGGARQVSAFGGEDESDHLDVWEVSWDKGGAAHWLREKKVRARGKWQASAALVNASHFTAKRSGEPMLFDPCAYHITAKGCASLCKALRSRARLYVCLPDHPACVG